MPPGKKRAADGKSSTTANAYAQKWFHLRGALFPGLLYGTVTGLIVGLLVVVR